MKNVVLKISFNHPNRGKSVKLNTNYISYICKRPRSVHNENKSFSCFGKVSEIGFNKFGSINDFEKIREHIEKKSKDKTTIYKAIVSITEEDALNNGFDKREKWENLIKNNASNFAKEMGIKIEDFEYVGAFHYEKGHPHIHLMVWDKNQEVQRGVLPKKAFVNIRKKLTKDIFAEEVKEFYQEKNSSKKLFNDFVKNSLDDILKMDSAEYRKIKNELLSLDKDLHSGKISNINLSDNYVSNVFKDIYKLKEVIPKKGRLNYGFMPQEAKSEIDKISEKILNGNVEVKSAYIKYINSVKSLAEFHSKDEVYIKNQTDKAEQEMNTFIGNQVLNIYKNINSNEWQIKKENLEESHKNFEKQQIINLTSNFLNFLTRTESVNNKNIERERTKPNSMKDKKELAKKLENKSMIDWER